MIVSMLIVVGRVGAAGALNLVPLGRLRVGAALGRPECNVFDAIARAVAHRGSRSPAVATTA